MWPVRQYDVRHAITAVSDLHTGHADKIMLRVGLADGTVVEGFLVSVAVDHLDLRPSTGEKVFVDAELIRSIYVGQPRPVRELFPVAGVIVGVTVVIVGLSQIPAVVPWFSRIAASLAIIGLVGLREMKRRTRLGKWLTAWYPLLEP